MSGIAFPRWRWRGRGLTSALLAIFAGRASAQQGGSSSPAASAEVVRGEVPDSSGAPVSGVSITVTGLQSLSERTTRTDSHGNYSVLFGDGDGQYVVIARASAFQPQGVRIARAPGSESPFPQANITLPHSIATLDSAAGWPRVHLAGAALGRLVQD